MQPQEDGATGKWREVLREAPRRYALPALPAQLDAARAAGAEVTIAFALESVRLRQATPAVRAAFTDALRELVQRASDADPVFQAQLLRASDAEVAEFVEHEAGAAADRRAVRVAVDAWAHPGKLRDQPPGPQREALERLHTRVTQQDWSTLAALVAGEPRLATAAPALARLARLDALRQLASVQRYLALGERAGPMAGSDAAVAQGRAAASTGDAAEAVVMEALQQLAAADERVVRGLRTPAGFPARRSGAKDEFDVAVLRGEDLVLLAEVKASPAAAATDLPRLLRGLQRLAQASGSERYSFPCEGGEVILRGASLQALAPVEGCLPGHVVYCSTAPVESRPAVLSSAARAMLLAESIPLRDRLERVWELLHEPRLQTVVQQYETARRAREAMVHPGDLLPIARGITGVPASPRPTDPHLPRS